jgi:hypothetical protein
MKKRLVFDLHPLLGYQYEELTSGILAFVERAEHSSPSCLHFILAIYSQNSTDHSERYFGDNLYTCTK